MSPEKSGPNWGSNPGPSDSLLPLELYTGSLVAEECRIDVYILRLSSHPINVHV